MPDLRGYKRSLTASILSLSLLTVMAGAAVAPALGVIHEYFSDVNQLFVQMIISMPAIFIVITNFIFPVLGRKFTSKGLVVIGLLLYTVGGCAAGFFSNIFLVLVMRALVGVGVGIIMPLSTGLLSFYFPPREQEKLMGYSSAMNQMGGVIATLLAGVLANISWRASFLVYLLGLFSLILCAIFLPNKPMDPPEKKEDDEDKRQGTWHIFKDNWIYIVCMFLLMTTFFIYPANFAMETISEGIIPAKLIAVIMAGMDFIAFFGGLLFARMKKLCGKNTKIMAPIMFLCGYLLLAFVGGWVGILAGSVFVGFANGAGIPFIISSVSIKMGKAAGTTVMPLISAALYLAQFLSPVFMSLVNSAFSDIIAVDHLSYCFAAVLAAVFCLLSAFIPSGAPQKNISTEAAQQASH